ncbi:MAG: hypothetical protein ACREBV_04085, partial [Candidatus Zixiibacteriota bacterium]
LSVDIEITAMDSFAVDYNVHTVTLNTKNPTIGKRFKSEYGLPAIVDDIEVKTNSFYSLTLVPQSRTVVSDQECRYNHNSGGDFTIFPSANFDLHYLNGSLAFYHGQAIKNLMETEYRLFRGVFHFNVSSKLDLFAFPCEGHSVIWDRRYGNAIDPTRNNCYALYATDVNTTDPYILVHSSLMRSYGYAPPFLSEGFANYFSLAIHHMKKIKKSGKMISLGDLLRPRGYLSADPAVADASAATFVRYLIDLYSAGTFKELYAAADDLNLKTKIETTYSKSLETLEREWQNYIDTLAIPSQFYIEFGGRAQQMQNYPLALEYRQAAYELSRTHEDSLLRLEQLADAFFLSGDYFNAASSQKRLAEMDPKNRQHLLGLAGYRMMNGDYELALKNLNAAATFDPKDEVLKFNFGLNALYRGDSSEAGEIWGEIVHASPSGQLQGEPRVMLGLLLRQSENLAEKQEAQNLFTIAVALFNQQVQIDPSVPNPYLWTGIALLGLDDAENAYDQLKQALFLESRPFYTGMINLWLGKAADLRGKRELARNHYSLVMSGASAAYHRDEAAQYLEQSYHQ